jgi:hypothetical protein
MLMPEWMHSKVTSVPKDPSVEAYFQKKKKKCALSVFSSGYGRQCVMTKEMAREVDANKRTDDVYRIYQWDENTSKQNYHCT